MRARRGGDIDGLYAERGQPIEVADDGEALAEILGGLVGQRLGVRAHGVAGGHQRKVLPAGAVQLVQPKQVSVPHPAAADDR